MSGRIPSPSQLRQCDGKAPRAWRAGDVALDSAPLCCMHARGFTDDQVMRGATCGQESWTKMGVRRCRRLSATCRSQLLLWETDDGRSRNRAHPAMAKAIATATRERRKTQHFPGIAARTGGGLVLDRSVRAATSLKRWKLDVPASPLYAGSQ